MKPLTYFLWYILSVQHVFGNKSKSFTKAYINIFDFFKSQHLSLNTVSFPSILLHNINGHKVKPTSHNVSSTELKGIYFHLTQKIICKYKATIFQSNFDKSQNFISMFIIFDDTLLHALTNRFAFNEYK